ncbi:sulfotransferase domain-containing protein [Rhabdochromatium marinum]|uniref:sulfotransferase domain-containing protein n=1 Tax=Rhabdochromatium marinum TaxID=48729 RepID=UPI0019033645|nr:sulfotransferase domain-containing protein [Rhabdochromatium marinum]MBK1647368.1 hypothetical protein [Rhabdochromatium marinum]
MFRVLGIGAQKAGTSWLYEMLLRHSAISFPQGKEVHFWNHPATLSRALIQDYLRKFSDPEHIEGEITPAYGTLNAGRVRLIHDWQPRLRLLFVMRNPIERAWSSALMALKRAELEFGEASEQWFIDHFRSHGSLARGDYLHTIKTWQNAFGADALLILQYQDIALAPRTLLDRVAEHIGIDPNGFNALSDEMLRKKVFQGIDETIPDALRGVLEAIYRPRIHALERYLGESLQW